MNNQSALFGTQGTTNQVGQNPQVAGSQSLTPSNTPLQTNAVSLFDGQSQTINVNGSQISGTAVPANGTMPPKATSHAVLPITLGVVIVLCVIIAIVFERLKAKSWNI